MPVSSNIIHASPSVLTLVRVLVDGVHVLEDHLLDDGPRKVARQLRHGHAPPAVRRADERGVSGFPEHQREHTPRSIVEIRGNERAQRAVDQLEDVQVASAQVGQNVEKGLYDLRF